MEQKSYEGWIVDIKERSYKGILQSFWCGIYYRLWPKQSVSTDVGDLLGVRTMIFRTRDQAREVAAYIDNQPWPYQRNAIVRKVKVTIDVIGHG